MRDRVQLCANIFRPSGVARGPVLLVRTPYGKPEEAKGVYEYFVEQGYAVVIQDVRGRYDSEGRFRPVEQETADGEDTLNWIGRQPWCDGNVGMLGGSYLGIAQWRAALGTSKYLKAIFPVVSGSDEYLDRYYSTGGAMKLGHRLSWLAENLRLAGFPMPAFSTYVNHVPLRTSDMAATGQTLAFYQMTLDHPAYDVFWKEASTYRSLGRVKVPAFVVGGWYDNYVQSDLAAFQKLQARFPEDRVVIGPWPHNMSVKFAGVDFGKNSGAPIRLYQRRWFDRWLRGKAVDTGLADPVQLFVMGDNRWEGFGQWPPAESVPTPFFLDSGGGANTLAGDGRLLRRAPERAVQDRFVYDPANPTPTRGGAVCCNPDLFPWGPMDQRQVEKRKDVLVYTTRPLRADLEVVGRIQVVLYVESSAADTDFTAKLVDVFPDGHARNLTDGILRLRYRKGLERPALMEPGKVYAVTVDAGVTANVFKAGHQIRLEVSSSNFPRFDRNPNTGRAIADETEWKHAHQAVWHGPARPSHLLLPVVPARQVAAARRMLE